MFFHTLVFNLGYPLGRYSVVQKWYSVMIGNKETHFFLNNYFNINMYMIPLYKLSVFISTYDFNMINKSHRVKEMLYK